MRFWRGTAVSYEIFQENSRTVVTIRIYIVEHCVTDLDSLVISVRRDVLAERIAKYVPISERVEGINHPGVNPSPASSSAFLTAAAHSGHCPFLKPCAALLAMSQAETL